MMTSLTPLQLFAIWTLPVLFAITIHEVAHGWVALKYGDKTAFWLGRLTLNPLKHIDPVGTIIVPAILLFLGGFIFGWAKPVPVNQHNLRNPKRDMAIVAVAGPLVNLAMACGWALIAKIGWLPLVYMGRAGIIINVVLCVLNLLPIPPLDGSKVLAAFLPRNLAMQFSYLDQYGLIILAIFLATGVLQKIISPPIYFVYSMIISLFGL